MMTTATPEKKEALAALSDAIAQEFAQLWLLEDYEEGMHIFLDVLQARKQELLALD